MPNHLGGILMKIGDSPLSEAERWIKKAIHADRENGMIFQFGRDYKLFSEFLKCKGAQSESIRYLNTAIKTFRECGADERAKISERKMAAIK